MSESLISNARYAVGNSNRGQRRAIIESIIPNTRDAVRDSGILTTCNKGVSFSFDNCIAVVAAIVDSITFFYKHRGKGSAMSKSRPTNARYAVRDGDGGKGGAIIESILFNARYAVADGDGGEGGAIIESPLSNARYAVGDSYRGEGGAIMESITSNARYAVADSHGGEG